MLSVKKILDCFHMALHCNATKKISQIFTFFHIFLFSKMGHGFFWLASLSLYFHFMMMMNISFFFHENELRVTFTTISRSTKCGNSRNFLSFFSVKSILATSFRQIKSLKNGYFHNFIGSGIYFLKNWQFLRVNSLSNEKSRVCENVNMVIFEVLDLSILISRKI